MPMIIRIIAKPEELLVLLFCPLGDIQAVCGVEMRGSIYSYSSSQGDFK
jgi:hypothetical protein